MGTFSTSGTIDWLSAAEGEDPKSDEPASISDNPQPAPTPADSDIIHTYDLLLTPEGQKKVDEGLASFSSSAGEEATDCELEESSTSESPLSTNGDNLEGKAYMVMFQEGKREILLHDDHRRDPRDPSSPGSSLSEEEYARHIASGKIIPVLLPYITCRGIYVGPIHIIQSNIQWNRTCKHNGPVAARAPTVKVSVAAKLSNEGDMHLDREARMYQRFPSHFYERWTGWCVAPPIKDPAPCGPIVPQFYGYYVPPDFRPAAPTRDENGEWLERPESPPYLSPILLLENCGLKLIPLA